MGFKTIKTIRNDKWNNKKDLKRPFYLPFYTVFIISIQYESINLSFYMEMVDKNDIKG